MKNKTVIILGSSRSNGNTAKIVDYIRKLRNDIDVLYLNNYEISYFDYECKNSEDDFFELYKNIITYKTIIFATPIYWYTMSAQIKTFFDRISDVLKDPKKEFGRKLRDKNMSVISCGSDDELFEGFEMPFRESANYLGMNYKGHVHSWIENDSSISKAVRNNLKLFLEMM